MSCLLSHATANSFRRGSCACSEIASLPLRIVLKPVYQNSIGRKCEARKKADLDSR